MKCDFCSSALIATAFKCHSFKGVRYGIPVTSDSDWCACHDCAKFVRAKDKDGLLERSFTTYFETNPEARALNRQGKRILKREIRDLHRGFWLNFIGEEEIPAGPYRVINRDPVRETRDKVADIMMDSLDPEDAKHFKEEWDKANDKAG